ncbi:hypothetical protein [Microvirga pakistanensis]|uniref:hypothetical protein n=1 Tax=Microvirga pakistanensis TaxID=1682650 RepID=UPI001069D654|nr:hypothetical protein [Microvirga pakistanensis]
MSGEVSVRIERLDLKVEHRDLAVPFRNDLEDALRTAGRPRLPPGARLTIRKLRLGRIPAGWGRQVLSLYLDAQLANVDYAIALPDVPPPDGANAVLVPDLVTAAAIAFDALATGRPLPWYVRDIFPGVDGLALGSAAHRIIEILIAEAGLQAPGRLAEIRGGLRRMIWVLDMLTEQHLKLILAMYDHVYEHDFQCFVADVLSPLSNATSSLPLHTFPSGRGLIEIILSSASSRARDEILAASSAIPASPVRVGLLIVWLAAARTGPSTVRSAFRQMVNALRQANPAPSENQDPAQPVSILGLSRKSQDMPDYSPTVRLREIMPSSASSPKMEVAGQLPDAPLLEGAFSDYAGLWLLLPALQLVGLDMAERATGLSLGHGVLSAFAARLGLGGTDPAASYLEQVTPGEPLSPETWLPRRDLLKLTSNAYLKLTRLAPGKASIGFRHGNGELSVIGPEELRTLRAEGFRLRTAQRTRGDFPSRLHRGLALAAQRLVSHTTGMGWRRLATRRGRIVVTATHLDIEFDGRDVNTAIRIAGLDLDPGWVPCLGRVVSFHYDYSKVRYFSTGGLKT